MTGLLTTVSYLPILKWKKGEWSALASLPDLDRDRMAPVVVMPPAGDYDPDLDRPLEPAEHIKSFGRRLYDAWGARPIFVDGLHVDDEQHRAGFDVHPLTALLERARSAGARPSPVTALGRSTEYQAAVARFMARHAEASLCLRTTPLDLETGRFAEDLDALLEQVGCAPERVIFVLDFGSDHPAVGEEFVTWLADRLNHLPYLYRWLQLAVALTSFPEKIKANAGECTRRARHDWEIYQRLLASGSSLSRPPIFGDYALEFPDYRPVGRVTPRARLRYSTSSEYLIENGTTTKKPHGYQAIYPVAAALTDRPEFFGPEFGAGDRFMWQLRLSKRGPGAAWQWRWAATDHHLRMVGAATAKLLGREEAAPAPLQEKPMQATFL